MSNEIKTALETIGSESVIDTFDRWINSGSMCDFDALIALTFEGGHDDLRNAMWDLEFMRSRGELRESGTL